MDDLAIDLTKLDFKNVNELYKEVTSRKIYKSGANRNLKFLIVNAVQRYMILLEADSRCVDRVEERFLGLKIAVIKS